jgi:molybdate transport system ATP-binding protein
MNQNTIALSLARPGFALQVDLTLPPRGITVLFGPSGCGKTSLLRCVAGLERGHNARVHVGGHVWQDDSQKIFLPTWKRALGYVFQEASLFEHLTVQRNLEYGLLRDRSALRISLNESIELLGIGHLLQRRSHELSGGERQRVAIARALASQPQLLLMDEPLAALDHARRLDILPWLQRLRDELHIPMLYVTHSPDELARLADTVVVMAKGRVTASGPASEILSQIDPPLVAGDDAGCLLDGTVMLRDTRWHLASIALGSAQAGDPEVWLRDDAGAAGLQIGHRVRLRILARDVSLTTRRPLETSIQNILPGTVDAIAPDTHPSQALVRVVLKTASAQPPCAVVARMTLRAVHSLGLAVGMPVWAQVKSAALVG